MSRRPIAAWLLILAAWGCQSIPAPDAPGTERAPETLDTPEDLLAAAAAASGARESRLYLEAAEQFLNDGDVDAAAAALTSVDTRRLRDGEAARYWIARAAVALAWNDLAAAETALDALDERHLREPMEAVLLRADLLSRQGLPHVAVDYLGGYASTHPELRGTAGGQRLNDATWHHLGQMPALEFLGRPPAPDSSAATSAQAADGTIDSRMDNRMGDAAVGWWHLKSEVLQSFTLADQRRRLGSWQAAWPNHPAALQPPSALLPLSNQQMSVTRVGLMLPLSGPLSRAGRAVRDAFIAAYLAHRDDAGFEVAIYDVAAEPLPLIYEQALIDGAQVLIGPLSRESVAEMNQLNPDVPVLMLNYLGDEPPAPNVLQLGLAIEDEAATLARWLNDQQVGRLLLFHNDEEWSVRAMQAVARDWHNPINVAGLRDIRTVTESVGAAMNVTASQQRRADLQELLRQDLQFVPRAREDVDAIVALVSPVEVSALVPALRFHFAHNVPIYATSQTLRGVSRQRLNMLNGFHVSELPWFVVDTASYDTISEAFALDGNVFAALYALGVDAFRLAERAPLILNGSVRDMIGSTGILRFTADGRIDRSLARAVVRNGRLEYVSRRNSR
jgi:uncharacterized protein